MENSDVNAAKPEDSKPSEKPGKKKKQKSDKPEKLSLKKYLKELAKLQSELCILQEWVKYKGLRVIVIFEGRDGAGKGGTIRALTERVSAARFQAGRAARTLRSREVADVPPALHGAFSGGR